MYRSMALIRRFRHQNEIFAHICCLGNLFISLFYTYHCYQLSLVDLFARVEFYYISIGFCLCSSFLLLRVFRVCCSCYCCGLSEFVVRVIVVGCQILLLFSCYCWGLSEFVVRVIVMGCQIFVVPVIVEGCQSLLFPLLLRVVRVCCSCYCCGLSEFVVPVIVEGCQSLLFVLLLWGVRIYVPVIIAGCYRAWFVLLLRVIKGSASGYCWGLS